MNATMMLASTENFRAAAEAFADLKRAKIELGRLKTYYQKGWISEKEYKAEGAEYAAMRDKAEALIAA